MFQCTHFAFYRTHFASYFSLKVQHYYVIKLPKIHQMKNVKHTEHQVVEKLGQYDKQSHERYVNFLLCGTVFSCSLGVQEVHYYCSVEVFTIKFHPSAYFALLGKVDSPFCLQNCLYLLAAYFAQNSASKFCQGLIETTLNSHDVLHHCSRYCKSHLEFKLLYTPGVIPVVQQSQGTYIHIEHTTRITVNIVVKQQ